MPSQSTDLQQVVFYEFHASPSIGHSRFLKMYERAQSSLFWKGVKWIIQQMLAYYDIFQHHKGEMTILPRLVEYFPIPTRIWTDILMAFIEGLPKYGGKTIILVVVDRISKYSHFCSLSHPYTTSSITQIFMDQIFFFHGIPSSIVSDRNTIFTSHFCLTDTKMHPSSVYHSPIDGPTIVINKY